MIVCDISLNIKSETVKQYFTQYNMIIRFLMTITGLWKRAYVIYDTTGIVDQLHTRVWLLPIMNFSIRMHPLNLFANEMKERNAYTLTLSGLPKGII